MVYFTGCKINLGLHVVSRRNDGFHNLDSIFYPVKRHEVLEAVPGVHKNGDRLAFYVRGLNHTLPPGTNLCEIAFHLLHKKFSLPETTMYLQKNIPAGSGLGAGSANAAGTIHVLNSLYALKMQPAQMFELAMELGSDAGFFIYNRPAHVTGRGEKMHFTELDLSLYYLVMVHPPFSISTAEAFAGIRPNEDRISTLDIIRKFPVSAWKDHLENDFESSLFPAYPQLADIKNKLYGQGAIYASMSGSGSCIYGLFETNPEKKRLQSLFSDCEIYVQSLREA